MLLFAAVDGLGWFGDGPDVVGNGWDVMVKGLVLLGGYFLYTFSGFAIDRSKKYIKTIKIDRKIDAVDPQRAADNPPSTPRSQWLGLWPPTTPQTPSNSAVS